MADDPQGLFAPQRPGEASAPRVFTIGHSTRGFDELMGMLRRNGVTDLVDIRSLPGSKKFPQWDQEVMRQAMPDDIRYRWMRNLGGRRYTRVGTPTPNTFWRVKAFRDYADYMATDAFHAGLGELVQLARTAVPAIMCSEAVPWRCHRRLVTDALLAAGCEVYDIMSATVTRRAALTPAAVVDEDGSITYPGT